LIVVDTSALFAVFDEDHPRHGAVRQAFDAERGPFLLSCFVVAELDYLLATRIGVRAELTFLKNVADGEYRLESFAPDEIATMHDLIARYEDLEVGLTDVSLVVLAERAGTNRILTLDERDFRAMRPLRGRSFAILPADA
jgi:hypothetical protein